jgi:pyrroline-5-carboxylate reductase
MSGNKPSIALAGCGKMGSAMASAWLKAGIVETLFILDPSPLPVSLREDGRVKAFMEVTAFLQGIENCDVLVLAVKPQIFEQVCESLTEIPSNLPVLSIAAGKMIASMEKIFGNRPLFRAMPNTPAAIGKGVTAAVGNSHVKEDQKPLAEKLLSAFGLFVWLEDEKLMDAVTALSGSGPAYLFYMIEALAKAGEKAGLSQDKAMIFARQTIIGAAALAEAEPDSSPARLRENVTSPGGTTAAALSVLMDGRFEQILADAVAAAKERSEELSA